MYLVLPFCGYILEIVLSSIISILQFIMFKNWSINSDKINCSIYYLIL